ncbi:MAG TPA: HlyD family efflux transporter periplasmic adaptor subunit [Pseudonocardia sp.]|nr:HlyD family efflux transporter periplasmic adaptor subunit [Pseudonocardia sp.]
MKGPDAVSNVGLQQEEASRPFRTNGASRRPASPAPTPTEPSALAETPTETPAPQPAAAAAQEQPVPEQPAPPAKQKMKRSRRLTLIVLAIVVLLGAAGGGGAYLINASHYVSTDNAQVDGDKVDINAPATGTLTDWNGDQGTSVSTDQVIGRVQIQGTGPQETIKSPGNGTIAVNDVVNGQWVTAGTELATAYDFNKIYITARVDETDVEAVHPGQLVDIDVDAYSGTPVTGTVEEVQAGAADEFSLFPEDNSTGNFQKVTQVIPVKIAIDNTSGLSLVPGMNVTVHIHKS